MLKWILQLTEMYHVSNGVSMSCNVTFTSGKPFNDKWTLEK